METSVPLLINFTPCLKTKLSDFRAKIYLQPNLQKLFIASDLPADFIFSNRTGSFAFLFLNGIRIREISDNNSVISWRHSPDGVVIGSSQFRAELTDLSGNLHYSVEASYHALALMTSFRTNLVSFYEKLPFSLSSPASGCINETCPEIGFVYLFH